MSRRKRRRRIHIIPDIIVSLFLTVLFCTAYVSTHDPAAAPQPTSVNWSSLPTVAPTRAPSSLKATATPLPQITYIGNKRSKVLHRSTCSYVKQMNESNKLVYTDRQEAIDDGYHPCSRCKP